jgi:2-polyprenyl-3-methyl-5-hydroxy-6-metoxy-1,4-benzoquinol methylase
MEKLTRTQIWDYWKNPDQQNNPIGYLTGAGVDKRSEYLVNKIKSIFKGKRTKYKRILELGCNSGRNLKALYDQGFTRLGGIDISEKALEVMKDVNNDIYMNCDIYAGEIEEILANLQDDEYDMIFTMATLMCIHPASDFIFDIIKKKSLKYILTIEFEKDVESNRIFGRDYKAVFEDENWKEIETEIVGDQADPIIKNFTYRLFKRKI